MAIWRAFGAFPQRIGRSRWAAAIVALVVLGTSLGTSALLIDQYRQDRISVYQDAAPVVMEGIQTILDDIEREALAIAGLASVTEALDTAAFSTFLDTALAAPGVIGRGIATRSSTSSDPNDYVFTLWEPAAGGPDWTGERIPARRTLGADILRMVDSQDPQASGFMSLNLGRRVFMVFAPTNGDEVASVLVDVEALLVSASVGGFSDLLEVTVHESTPTPDGSFVATQPAYIGERSYQVQIRPRPGSGADDPGSKPWLIGIAASLIAALLTAIGTEVALERRRVHRELEDAKALDQSRVEFLASVSHELRTPITAVTGFTQILRDRWDDLSEDERKDMLVTVDEQGAEVAALVNDLLVLARAEIGDVHLDIESVNVSDVVRRALDSVPQDQRNRIAVDVPDLFVAADVTRLSQVVRNLLMNAVIHGSGVVGLFAEDAGSRHVVLTVSDEGNGIPEEHLETIFDPFVSIPRASQPLPSIGVGLFVARRLAELMDGSLSYRRDHGLTVFELRLPTSTRPSGSDSAAADGVPLAAG